MIYSTFRYMIRSMNLGAELLALNPCRFFGARPILRYSPAVIQTLGVIDSLIFMWSVGNPSGQRPKNKRVSHSELYDTYKI